MTKNKYRLITLPRGTLHVFSAYKILENEEQHLLLRGESPRGHIAAAQDHAMRTFRSYLQAYEFAALEYEIEGNPAQGLEYETVSRRAYLVDEEEKGLILTLSLEYRVDGLLDRYLAAVEVDLLDKRTPGRTPGAEGWNEYCDEENEESIYLARAKLRKLLVSWGIDAPAAYKIGFDICTDDEDLLPLLPPRQFNELN